MDIRDAKILILATDGFEQSELMTPKERLQDAGATVHVASPRSRQNPQFIRGWEGKDWGDNCPVDMDLDQIEAGAYDALVIPGGQINPDLLRVEPNAVDLVRQFASAGKVIAAVCHGPWLLVEAGLARGRRMTSYHSIKTDVTNAGATWVDEEVVADNGIVTSRSPGDLEAFSRKIIEEVQEGRHQRDAS